MTKTIGASKTTIDLGSVQPGQIATDTATISATGTEGVNVTKLDLVGDPGFTADAEGLVYPAVAYVDGVDYYLTALGEISTTDDGTGILLGTGNASGGLDLTIEAAGILSSLPISWDYGTVSTPTAKTFVLSADQPDSVPIKVDSLTLPSNYSHSESLPLYVPVNKDILSFGSYTYDVSSWRNDTLSAAGLRHYLPAPTSASDFFASGSFTTGDTLSVGAKPFYLLSGDFDDRVSFNLDTSLSHELQIEEWLDGVAYTNATVAYAFSINTQYYWEFEIVGGSATLYFGTTLTPPAITGLINIPLTPQSYQDVEVIQGEIPIDSGHLNSFTAYIPTESESNKILDFAYNGEYTYNTANPTTPLEVTYDAGATQAGNVEVDYTFNAGADSGTLIIPVEGTKA